MLSLSSMAMSVAERAERDTQRRPRRIASANRPADAQSTADDVRMRAAVGLESMRRELLLRSFSWMMLVAALLMPLAAARGLATRPWTIYVHVGLFSILLPIWLMRHRISTALLGAAFLGGLYVVGTVALLRVGILGINGLAYGLLVLAAPQIFGVRVGAICALMCVAAYAVIGALTINGVLVFERDLLEYLASPTNWIHTGGIFLGFVLLAVVVSGMMNRKLRELLKSEAARSQLLVSANERLAEANERLRELNANLEQRIDERTRSLEQANRELETFCYTVSHDLRSPLQVIEGFSSLALQEEGHASQAKVRDYLHRIQTGSRRMHDMIGQLLRFSQLGTAIVHRGPVNLSEMAERILTDMRVTEPGRIVSVSVQPNMTDSADPELVESVLRNLLSNAWKFTSRSQAPSIEFQRVPRGDAFVYMVRDNGAGFDAKCAERLFQPFVRLHDKREFPGNGVGLATAQRIIDRHQGRIWVESRCGEGATFFFTLAPAAEDLSRESAEAVGRTDERVGVAGFEG